MKGDEIRSLLHSQPFAPFDLHLADGRKFHVALPDFIATARKPDKAIVYREDDAFNIRLPDPAGK